MQQKIIDRSYVGEVLQHVYTSDFDIGIALFSSGGYFYSGSENKKIPLQGTTIEEAVTNLATRLASEFPNSTFAEWWTKNFTEERNQQ